MQNDINNFIKWLVIKVFIINEVSSATKIARALVFLYESDVFHYHFYLNVIEKILNNTQ